MLKSSFSTSIAAFVSPHRTVSHLTLSTVAHASLSLAVRLFGACQPPRNAFIIASLGAAGLRKLTGEGVRARWIVVSFSENRTDLAETNVLVLVDEGVGEGRPALGTSVGDILLMDWECVRIFSQSDGIPLLVASNGEWRRRTAGWGKWPHRPIHFILQYSPECTLCPMSKDGRMREAGMYDSYDSR